MLKTVSSYVNVIGALNYKGTWDASTNSPTLASGVGTKGDYYVVSVAGSTTIDGQNLWGVGDWIVFNGTAWQRVDGGSTGNFTTISASGDSYFATSSGRVGIGTSSPNSPLEVRKDGDVGNGLLAVTNTDAAGLQSRAAARFATSAGDVGYVGAHCAGTGAGIGFANTMVVYGLLSSGVRIVASNASGSVQIAAGGAASNKIFLNISSAGNVVCNNAAIATNATDGFLYVPSCAGTPTGTPTAFTGRVPIVVDSTNNKFYFYSGGAWRDAGP